MKRNIVVILSALILVFFSITNCRKDEKTAPKSADTLSALDLHINQFIWYSLHDYYLWVDNVPNLSFSKYASESKFKEFLEGYSDHEKLFNDLLYNTLDKWSWIVDDYVALENMFQGVTLSMGYEFQLVKMSDNTSVFGFVKYVVKGGPADHAGIKRGDIFIKIDNQQLTVNNYLNLLSGKNSYSISFATISGNTISPNGKQVTLTAAEVHENPIYLDTIYNINGTKTGYLVYNGFMSDYDIQLNDVFKNFINQGVQQLILDLRYNSGGSVNSATYLSSMIYNTDTTMLFFKNKYNTNLQAYLDSAYGTKFSAVYFADEIGKTDSTSGTPINSLKLNKVYIITTNNSASASELVIAGLKPYINVITVGSNTYGKYVGSITIKDIDSHGVINPDHKWALQPIIMKAVNSAGLSDYKNGFAPTLEVQEDLRILLPFGNTEETLLKATINYIKGITKKSSSSTSGLDIEEIADSKDFVPHSKEMYFNKPIKIKRK
jgi:carboxyl-terminal processing protease